MTANSPQTTERLTRNNALLLLVDHQVGLYTGVRDIDILQLKHNIVGLTRAMLALKVPVIVTTTTEKMWGPLIPELAEVLHGVQRIERTTVNAWDEKRIVDALARRIASFDRRAIAAAKSLVNQVSLPSADRLLAAITSFETALTWPEAQQRIQNVLQRGLQRDSDFEIRWPEILGTLLET